MERTLLATPTLAITHPVRGVLHGSVALVAALALPLPWNATDLPGRRTALVGYGVMLAAMFAVSALHHSVPWSTVWKRRWRRLDHTMISVVIGSAVTVSEVLPAVTKPDGLLWHTVRELPMFPLGSPLMPYTGVPLHVFEERYRVMMRACMGGDRRFGVVLIHRGAEVGGGDERAGVGTLAEIADAQELPDGRWVLVAVGIGRLQVVEWLPDDPHPRALAAELDESSAAAGAAARDALQATARRIAGMLTELGDPAPPIDLELADDPVVAAYQAVAATPVAALDRQRLIEMDDPDARITEAAALLGDLEDLLRMRILR
jgi:Lon protease-like protein